MMRLTPPVEIPPTAGLPIEWRDLMAFSGDLAQQLSDWLLIPRPLLTCSGTAALVIALRVLQRRYPDRTTLIVPAYTCPLVALAAFYCPPLTVVPCDLAAGGINMDNRQLALLCDQHTLAVVVTHLAGRVADVDSALHIAGAVGAAVIEDAAQGMGAQDGGNSVGLKGDVGFFSMAMGKGLTCAEGGVLFSRDPALQQALTQTCQQTLPFSLGWELRRIAELWGYWAFYRPGGLYWVYGRPLRAALAKGDPVAAVGDDFTVRSIPLHRLGHYRRRVAASALRRLPGFLLRGKQRALDRVALLSQLPGVSVINDNPGGQGIWPFILVLMPDAAARDAVMASLWTAGLGVTRLFIHALGDYPAVLPLLAPLSPTPCADDFAARSLSITNSPWLTDRLFSEVMLRLRAALT